MLLLSAIFPTFLIMQAEGFARRPGCSLFRSVGRTLCPNKISAFWTNTTSWLLARLEIRTKAARAAAVTCGILIILGGLPGR